MANVHDNTRTRTVGEFAVHRLRVMADVAAKTAARVRDAADAMARDAQSFAAQADTMATGLMRGDDPDLTTRERLLADMAQCHMRLSIGDDGITQARERGDGEIAALCFTYIERCMVAIAFDCTTIPSSGERQRALTELQARYGVCQPAPRM